MITRSKLFLTILTVLFMTVLLAGTAFAQSVALEVEPADEAAEGEQVTLTADAEDFDNPEYRFAYRVSGKTKIYTPQTGTDNSWTITIPAGAAGTYDLGVQVREAGTSGWSSPPVHHIVFGYVITEEAAPPPPPAEDLEVVEIVAIDNRTVEVTTTPVPGDVTVNAEDFRAFVNGASRVITSYTNVDTTTHHLQLATPVFAVGDVIRIDGRQDVGGSAEYTVPAQTDVVEVGDLDELLFAVGTSELVVLENLPTAVRVTLQDGTVRNLGIENWSSATYNSTQEGTYLFTGDLVLVHNVTNTQNLQAEVEVTLTDAVFTGIVTDVSAITIEFNNNPAETFQVSSDATEILAYLGVGGTRTALRGTTATVFLNENDRIIRLLEVKLGAGVTPADEFTDLASANAPANMVIRGRDGSTVAGAETVAGSMLTLRDLNFTGDPITFAAGADNNTLLDSRAAGNVNVNGDGNEFDSVRIGNSLNIADAADVDGFDAVNCVVAQTLSLALAGQTSENVNIVGGSVGAAAAGTEIRADNDATNATIDGTVIGTTGFNTNVQLNNTYGLTIRNTTIVGTINDVAAIPIAEDLTLENVIVTLPAFADNSADGMDIVDTTFLNTVNVTEDDAVFTNSEFRNNVTVGAGVVGTIFEDCTLNNVAGTTVTVAPDSPVIFRGTTTSMSDSAANNQINTTGTPLQVRLEGVIEGGNSLNLNPGAPTEFNFTNDVSVNNAAFVADVDINGRNVLLNNVTAGDGIDVDLVGTGISVDSSYFAGDFDVTGRGAVFNATEFETVDGAAASRNLYVAQAATGVVFNNTVITSSDATNNNDHDVTSDAPDTIFNNTTFNVPGADIVVTGPVVATGVGTLTFNEFRYIGPNDVNTTANSGVIWNP